MAAKKRPVNKPLLSTVACNWATRPAPLQNVVRLVKENETARPRVEGPEGGIAKQAENPLTGRFHKISQDREFAV
jgi:hypothetical protein